MGWYTLRIARDATRVLVRPRPLRVTYPRRGRLVLAAVVFAAGLGVWLAHVGPEDWGDLLTYVWILLVAGPGAALLLAGLTPRPVIEQAGDEIRVRYGLAGLESLVTAFPVERVEVRVARQEVQVSESGALRGIDRFSARKPGSGPTVLFVLELRSRGQEGWLGVLGSRMVSEVENARLAIAGAAEECKVGEGGKGEEGEVGVDLLD